MHKLAYTYMHTGMYTDTYSLSACIYRYMSYGCNVYVCVSVCMQICLYIYICMYVCHACMRM